MKNKHERCKDHLLVPGWANHITNKGSPTATICTMLKKLLLSTFLLFSVGEGTAEDSCEDSRSIGGLSSFIYIGNQAFPFFLSRKERWEGGLGKKTLWRGGEILPLL